MASIGGFIASDKDTINFLRHNCRTYIFSASNTPAATAAALEALHIIQNEPERFENLWDVTNYALKRFREEGFEIGETESPIIPLYVRDASKTFFVTKKAYDRGVFINPVTPEHYGKVERGERTVNLDRLVQISHLYRTTVCALLEGFDTEAAESAARQPAEADAFLSAMREIGSGCTEKCRTLMLRVCAEIAASDKN